MYVKRFVGGLVILVLLVAGAYTLWGRDKQEKPAEAANQSAVDIPPVKAPKVVIADATVVPVRHAALSFGGGGTLAELLVNEGDSVEAGALLMRQESARQEAALAQARAQLSRAEAALAELKSGPRPQEVASAEAALDAARAQLAKVEVVGPPLEITVADAQVRRLTAQLDLVKSGARPESIRAAEAEVQAARAALAQAQAALDETELRAPFSGVIAAVESRVGEYVGPGTPIVWLGDTSEWRLETEDLTELGVVRVREGSTAAITFDALPDVEIAGRVIGIKPLGENRLGDITYQAVVALDELDPRLRWNMTAAVTIEE